MGEPVAHPERATVLQVRDLLKVPVRQGGAGTQCRPLRPLAHKLTSTIRCPGLESLPDSPFSDVWVCKGSGPCTIPEDSGNQFWWFCQWPDQCGMPHACRGILTAAKILSFGLSQVTLSPGSWMDLPGPLWQVRSELPTPGSRMQNEPNKLFRSKTGFTVVGAPLPRCRQVADKKVELGYLGWGAALKLTPGQATLWKSI